MRLLATLTGIFLGLLPQVALACPPPPVMPRNPGESDAAYQSRIQSEAALAQARYKQQFKDNQHNLFETAEGVVRYRVTGVRAIVDRRTYAGIRYRVSLVAEQTYRGVKSKKALSVDNYIDETSCGPYVAGYADGARKGDRYIAIFSSETDFRANTLIMLIGKDQAVASNVRAALGLPAEIEAAKP